MLTSFRHAVTEVLATSLDTSPELLVKSADSSAKTAMGKLLGSLLKQQKDPKRLANIARLASSRGAQLVESAPDAAKKYVAVGTAAAQRMAKGAADLTEAARAELPKKDFAVPAKKSNTGKPAYPIEDPQHARSALGFAKMHGDGTDYAAVRAKVQKKYPDLLKKQAMASAAMSVFMSKEAGKLMSSIAKGLKSDTAKRFGEAAKAELGPAAGAVLGAGLANAYKVNPLAGAAAGYGVGAIPEIIHAVRHRGA
jgi:hypothetical protein